MKKKEVLTRLNRLGLKTVKTKAGHYKVYAKSGMFMFDVSGSPSDENWFHGVERDLRKWGLSFDKGRNGTITETQESEAEIMTTTAPISRVKLVRGRLENFMSEKGDELVAKAHERFPATRPGKGKYAEFARVAFYEVAPATNLRRWKNRASAEQTISYFLRHQDAGMSVWALDLIETTMGYINENPEWGNYEMEPTIEEAKAQVEKALETEIYRPSESDNADEAEAEKDARAEEDYDPSEWSRSPVEAYREGQITGYKERYVVSLLNMLESGKHSDEVVAMEILPRLDKLLLGSDES